MSDDLGVDEDALKSFLGTTSFGKQVKASNADHRIDQSKRTEPEVTRPDESKKDKDEEEDDQDDSDDDDDSDDEDEFPVSHEMVIKTHDRTVTSIALDAAGGRMVTGSSDCTLKFHDFSSMTPTTIRAFKSVDPSSVKGSASSETHPVHHVSFNPISPRTILAITATPQPRILDRDGEILAEFVKGDMYLRDMHNTKGHISEVTSGVWHPTDRNICATGGTDSTVRIWDVNNPRSQKNVIVHTSRIAGSAGRTRITSVKWASSSLTNINLLVAAALDGSLVMWDGNGPYTRPAAEIRDAHAKGTWTAMDITQDGRTIVTRGGDDTIKLWDTRKFKQPIVTASHPSTSDQYPTTNICWSPNGANILAGSATGHLHILNPATLKSELVTPVTPGSPLVTVNWHGKLNQIITGSANAETHVLYNPNISQGGAKTVMLKAPKRRHIDDDPNLTMDLTHGIGDSVIVPGGSAPTAATYSSRHPTIGLTASGKSRDPRRPHVPAVTPFAKSNPDANYVKEQISLSSMRDEDPREALLKYAEKAKNDPMFTNVWAKTQPKTIYADVSDDEEEGGPDKKKAKR